MTEAQPDGLDALRHRLERRPRAIPPTRHPRAKEGPRDEVDGSIGKATTAGLPAASTKSQGSTSPTDRITQPRAAAPDQQPPTQPGEPLANLVLRPRRSLDYRLADLVHDLRRDGVRTSKVELVELLLWELPPKPTAKLRERLAGFRRQAPREPLL